ncbi:MAG TPA: carbohydrate ABC transporter permease [Candidatus Caenarcaniphilales bacterium]|nr:carbohydrate ABC transporter permease [Candidatus Caenarcaniphilales bacterium]
MTFPLPPATITRRRVVSLPGRPRWTRGNVVKFLILTGFAIFFLLPVLLMLITGLKPFADVSLARMWELPSGIYLDNFQAALAALGPNLANSIMLAVPAAILSSVLGSMNGYILSKWRFRGSDIIFTLFLFGMFIPYQSILIPLVQFMNTINPAGGIPGLILVHVVYGIPITTLIFRNYYATLPGEVVESARIDGAGFFGIYRHIALPLSLPGFAVVLIWQFTNIWNEFLFAIVLTRPSSWPVTVALNNLAGSQIVEWNVQMAGALLAALPTLLVYIVLGRFFLRGLMAGALKG